jgi:tetratricopeptide (TPR) repeat protein
MFLRIAFTSWTNRLCFLDMSNVSSPLDQARTLAKFYLSLTERAKPFHTAWNEVRKRIDGASWALHEIGSYFHHLILLKEVMDRFVSAGNAADPKPAFFDQPAMLPVNSDLGLRARRCYQAALILHPNQAETLYNLAVLDLHDGLSEQAFSAFERVIELAPSSRCPPQAHLRANALWNMALILDGSGRSEDAATAFSRALQLLGNFGVQHRVWADWLQQHGRSAEAIEQYHLLMSYSHRYAPELLLPDLRSEERAARDECGGLLDPFTISPVKQMPDGGQIVYHALLYFKVPAGMDYNDPAILATAIRTAGLFGRLRSLVFNRECSSSASVSCAFALEALTTPDVDATRPSIRRLIS